MNLIKPTKSRLNKKIILPRETNQHTCRIEIQNCWKTQVFQILHEERGDIFSKGSILSIRPKPVELSHGRVLTNFNYKEPSF